MKIYNLIGGFHQNFIKNMHDLYNKVIRKTLKVSKNDFKISLFLVAKAFNS